MSRTLPLAERHAALGARFEERQGWSVPARYQEPADEVHALREGAVALDLSDRGAVRVTGADRVTFLQGQLSNDVTSTPAGRGCHATLLTRTGKLVSDLHVWVDRDEHWLDIEPARVDATVQALDRFIISEDVELLDGSAALAHLAVAGPAAVRVGSEALGADLAALEPLAQVTLGDGTRVARRRAAGADLLELWCATSHAAERWEALIRAGARPLGRDAWDLAALEAGEARWGIDVDETHNPLEANLEDAISYTKGCYVGQEVIAKATHLGRVSRRLVGLVTDDGEPLGHDDSIEVEGEDEPVGRVTRGALSPTLGRPIALGYVKWKHAEPGTALRVRHGDGAPRTARIVALPFLESLR